MLGGDGERVFLSGLCGLRRVIRNIGLLSCHATFSGFLYPSSLRYPGFLTRSSLIFISDC